MYEGQYELDHSRTSEICSEFHKAGFWKSCNGLVISSDTWHEEDLASEVGEIEDATKP